MICIMSWQIRLKQIYYTQMRNKSVVPKGIVMFSYQYIWGYRCCVWYDSQIDIIIYHHLNIPKVSVVSKEALWSFQCVMKESNRHQLIYWFTGSKTYVTILNCPMKLPILFSFSGILLLKYQCGHGYLIWLCY